MNIINNRREKYEGFISHIYEDRKWFLWLKKILEEYRTGFIPNFFSKNENSSKFKPIFDEVACYDHDNDINNFHKKSLVSSKRLYIICSEQAKNSYEIKNDIKTYLENKPEGLIYFLIVGDEDFASPLKPEKYLSKELLSELQDSSISFEENSINIRGLSSGKASAKILSKLTGRNEKYLIFRKYSLKIISIILFIFLLSLIFVLTKKETNNIITSKTPFNNISTEKYINNLLIEKLELLEKDRKNKTAILDLISILSGYVNPDTVLIYEQNYKSGVSLPVSKNGMILNPIRNNCEVWDANNKKILFELTGHKDLINSGSFSLDGSLIITTSNDSTIKIWNSKNGELINSYPANLKNSSIPVMFPDNSGIVYLSNDNKLFIRIFKNESITASSINGDPKISTLEFSDKSSWLITWNPLYRSRVYYLGTNLPAAPDWLIVLSKNIIDNKKIQMNKINTYSDSVLHTINTELYGYSDVFAEWGKWFLKKYLFNLPVPCVEYTKILYQGRKENISLSEIKSNYQSRNRNAVRISRAGINIFLEQYKNKPSEMNLFSKYLQEYALEINPSRAEIWYNKAIIEHGLGNISAAFYAISKAIYIKPDYYDAWNFLGNLWLEMGSRNNSAVALRKSLDIIFDYTRKNKNLDYDFATIGSLLLDLGDRKYSLLAFKKDLEKNLPLAENDDPVSREKLSTTYGNLAFAELFNLHSKEAIISSIKGLKVDSTQLWLNINLSHSYILDNQFKKAKEIYRKYGSLKLYEYDNKTLGEIILEDLADLKKNGIYHPDMEKIKNIFSGKSAP